MACLEEIAFHNGWLSGEQVMQHGQRLHKTGYGQYLLGLLKEGF